MRTGSRLVVFVTLSLFSFFASSEVLWAQSTSIKLPTSDNSSSFDILKSDGASVSRTFADGGYYSSGTLNVGTIPVTGAGVRLMWHPGKAAFRAGAVSSFGATYWDDNNVGQYSVAMGSNTRASGDNSFALGLATTATGDESVALGNYSTASADRALTFNGTASAVGAIALGSGAQATNDDALALGPSSIASGLASIAIGPSIASGNFAVAIGLQNKANGQFSVAIGKNCRTAGRQGSCVIGDASASFSSDSVYATANNQMTMRFVGGYRLYTNQGLTSGVEMVAGGSSWSSVSDSTRKENFLTADGERFLASLSRLRLGSWNYKTQDPAEFRHYGPMAQEIFAYYGSDRYGKIGNDTLLASADMDGIIMICLQALEKRTGDLQSAKETIARLEAQLNRQQSAIQELTQGLRETQEMMSALKNQETFHNGSFSLETNRK